MLKKLFYFFLIVQLSLIAQNNLVMNPSFESYTACPNGTGVEINKIQNWDSCRASPDYFNSCSSTTNLQVPINYFGTQKPVNGNVYCGLWTYAQSGLYREYLIGKLAFPLVIGQKYYVSFKVNRADSLFVTGYSNNKIGVKFSVNKSGNVPINNIASYYSNTIINDTIGWTTIFGSFVSDSMYNFIMLGNFFDDLNTTYLSDFPGLGAYYYIDDVCVSTDSVFTIKYNTGINEFIDLNDIQVIPSNCNEYFYVNNIKTNSKIDVFDAIGRTCYTIFSVPDEVTRIDCSNWNNGFYYVRVNSFTKKNYS